MLLRGTFPDRRWWKAGRSEATPVVCDDSDPDSDTLWSDRPDSPKATVVGRKRDAMMTRWLRKELIVEARRGSWPAGN